MGAAGGAPRVAAVLAIVSAFLWATYYFFVLTLGPGSRPAAVVAYPFLVAGVMFAALAAYQGHFRAFLQMWRSPAAYLRTLLLVGMQVSVLASTYVAGPVDTSLLSLLGDVALTPLFLMVLYREGIDRARSPSFWGGLVLSSAGAGLTIVGGQSAVPIHGLAWLVAPTVALTVAFYFLLTAKANISVPSSAVIGQASLAAGLVGIGISPLLPGGFPGLWVPSLSDLGLIVGLGVTSFFIAPFLYFAAVERAGIILPALLMATIPVFTLAVDLAAFHIGVSPLALLGVPIAVVGGLVAIRGSHPGWQPSYAAAPDAGGK